MDWDESLEGMSHLSSRRSHKSMTKSAFDDSKVKDMEKVYL